MERWDRHSELGVDAHEPLGRVREWQVRLLVDALAVRGPMTRQQVSEHTGWARSTVVRVVGSLTAAGLLTERPGLAAGRRGRPPGEIALSRTAGVAIGLDLGFRHIRGLLADAGHNVLARAEVTMTIDYTPDDAAAAAETVVEQLLNEVEVPSTRVLGVGVAVPAPVNVHTRRATVSSTLPQWDGVPIGELLETRLGRSVLIDNDSKLAATGELRWGVAAGLDDVLYLRLHSGVGGAVVVGGKVVDGRTGAAGHVGHVSMDVNGPPCRCGSRGCLEVYAGIPAMLAELRPLHGSRLELAEALSLFRADDPACTRVFHDAAHRVGLVAGALCNVLNSAAVVIGGSLAEVGDLLVPHVRSGIRQASLPVNQDTPVLVGKLGRDACALGAIALVLSRGIADVLEVEGKVHAVDSGTITPVGQPDPRPLTTVRRGHS